MNKRIIERRSWCKPDGTKVTEEKSYTILEVSKWANGPVPRTRMRDAEGEKAWEIINLYKYKQAVADSIFLGSEFTTEIGEYYDDYLDVYKHACHNRKRRGLILSRSKAEELYTCLILIYGHAENSIDEAHLVVFEFKHKAEQQHDVINSINVLCHNLVGLGI